MAFNNNMFRLIEPFMDEVQLIENTLSDLRLKRSLDAAQGQQLDGLGDVLGRPRRVIATGTAQGGTISTIQLAAIETFVDDEINGSPIRIVAGTGVDQSSSVSDYVGVTDTATVFPTWVTAPDSTSLYEVDETDADYRGALKLEVILHRSNGEAETIISFAEEFTNIATVTAKLKEIFPAKYRLSLLGPQADIIKKGDFFKNLVQAIEKISAAGVGVDVDFQDSAFSTFAFGNEGAEVTDGDGFLEEGFDEITGSYTAGAMAEEV